MDKIDKKIHLGIIPDGNRRYCKKQGIGLEKIVDHWFNTMILQNVKKIVDSDFRLIGILSSICSLSLYVSSIDNVNRTDGSTDLGYELIRKIYEIYKKKEKFFTTEQIEKLEQQNYSVKFKIIGELLLIPDDIRKIIDEFKKYEKDNCFVINLAMAYDYTKDMMNFGSNKLINYNRDQTNIDCIFRSGNEQRTSGFFPCHSLYSELVFSEKLWPEIDLEDIKETINIYNKRKRRFGC